MKRNQQGLTLFVAMIILVMVTLLVVSAFRTSNTNLKIVNSMQGRQEALATAQAAVEQVLSSSFFAENPAITGATRSPARGTVTCIGYTRRVGRWGRRARLHGSVFS